MCKWVACSCSEKDSKIGKAIHTLEEKQVNM